MLRLGENRVAVVPIRDPEKSKGGIIIPDQAKERIDQGIVKYIGPGVKDIKIGDLVFFSAYTGQLFDFDDEGLLIIFHEDFAIAILEEPPHTTIPGLFFKSADDDTFFPATYEAAVQFIALGFQNAPWWNDYDSNGRRKWNVVTPKLTADDYKKGI